MDAFETIAKCPHGLKTSVFGPMGTQLRAMLVFPDGCGLETFGMIPVRDPKPTRFARAVKAVNWAGHQKAPVFAPKG